MFSLKFTAVLCKGLLSAIDNDPKFDLLSEEVDTEIKGGVGVRRLCLLWVRNRLNVVISVRNERAQISWSVAFLALNTAKASSHMLHGMRH